MKRLSRVIIIFAAIMSVGSFRVAAEQRDFVASGPDVTRKVDVKDVTAIEVGQALYVNYTVGSHVSVKYTAPESLVDCVDITCTGGILKCRYKSGINTTLNNRKIVIDVVAPSVSNFNVASAGTIDVRGRLEVSDFKVEASSAGKVGFYSVKATVAKIEACSAAGIAFNNLEAMVVDVESSSSSAIGLKGSLGKVSADVSSSGMVQIEGNCKILNAEVSSGGKVIASTATVGTGKLEATSGGTIIVPPASVSAYEIEKDRSGRIQVLQQALLIP